MGASNRGTFNFLYGDIIRPSTRLLSLLVGHMVRPGSATKYENVNRIDGD